MQKDSYVDELVILIVIIMEFIVACFKLDQLYMFPVILAK